MQYKVAGHLFEVRAEEKSLAKLLPLMDNYAPFSVDCESSANGKAEILFVLDVRDEGSKIAYVEETRQLDEGQTIVCGKSATGESVFEFYLGEKWTGALVCSKSFGRGMLVVSPLGESSRGNSLQRFALNNALMVFFALATSCANTALFHSAVIMRGGCGYMFLGKSGTGKSTHARMWLNHFDDAELLNDDNPVVRLEADGAWVYGSPWSGKTPCYRNIRAKLSAIVDLSQAPKNEARPIRGIEAYLALVASISGMRWNRKIADGLHTTENRLAQEVRMFHLDCLPDENAAEVCYGAVKNG